MKKLCKAAAAFLLCAGVLTGCGSKEDTKTEKKIPVVSVAQIVEHKSLNTIRDSFKAEMEALGYKDGENIKLDFKDAGGQQNTLNSIMSTFAGNKSYGGSEVQQGYSNRILRSQRSGRRRSDG